jgi:RHS repeat-associated protein
VNPYSYNASNELTATPSGSYTYDNNGNTLTGASGKSYTWDFENRLTQAIVPGTGTVTFKYDPFGRRIQKSSPLGTTNYLYDGPNLIEEVDNSGNVLARYTFRRKIDQPLSVLRSGVTSYYEQDGIGSVSALSNRSGSLANTYSYDSFGNLAASTGSIANPFRYTGREFDQETGIYFYRARYYDPAPGRFVRSSPACSGQSRCCSTARAFGFHTFRRTLASVLVANNYDPKLVQELLRHSNIKTTLDIYAQAITSAKLEAQGMFLTELLKGSWAEKKPATSFVV